MLYLLSYIHIIFFFFFFNDTATTEIYTLSLHDALPISHSFRLCSKHTRSSDLSQVKNGSFSVTWIGIDRKSTRLNSSHGYISYAVFCLKKKTKKLKTIHPHHASIITQLSQHTHTPTSNL